MLIDVKEERLVQRRAGTYMRPLICAFIAGTFFGLAYKFEEYKLPFIGLWIAYLIWSEDWDDLQARNNNFADD